MNSSTSRRLINTVLALAAFGTQALSQSDPTAALSFVTSDTVAPGATITVEVVCDFDTMTTDAGLFGAPGLFLFTCERLFVLGPASSTGSITIDESFPHLRSPGEYYTLNDVRYAAGAVGNASAVATSPATLFSFQLLIDSDATDGEEVSFRYTGSLVFDAGGGLFTFATDTPRAHTLIGSNEGSLTVEENCTAADLAEPYGVLDLADINTFTSGFLGTASIADLNEDGLFDLSDINLFTGSFLSGCP